MFIFTKKNKAKHDQTPLDIYFSNLEEAYGNLPVPSDDWAGVREKLESVLSKREVDIHIDALQNATEIIGTHYDVMAQALGKPQKYG